MAPGDAARAALERYRRAATERGEPAACLLERARELEALAGHQRRRAELVDRAVRESGLAWTEAEGVYDLAREEGLDPALAFELLHCRVLVVGPTDVRATDARAHTELEATPPEWVETQPPPEEEARRERRLRGSFRRLRRLIEERGTPEEALVAFAEEPDVGVIDGPPGAP